MPAPDPASQTSAIPPSAMPLISPNALLHAHLQQSPPSRPSGRSPTEARSISLNTGSLTHCNGSSLIKIGSTTIVCGVRAELLPVTEIANYRISKTTTAIPPTSGQISRNQDENYDAVTLYHLIVPNLELATGCSPKYLAGTPPSVEAQSVSQRLLSLLHTSKLVPTSDLEVFYTPPTVQEGDDDYDDDDIRAALGIDTDPQLKAYWVLYIDMICISYGGGIFDAAWMALYAALRDTYLPQAWWDVDLERVVCSSEMNDARRLNLRGMPVPLSFAVFVPEKRVLQQMSEEGKTSTLLVDPDVFEEECCDEKCCITVDLLGGQKKVLRIEKSGGVVLGKADVRNMTDIASRRWNDWKSVLQSTGLTS